MTSYTYSGIQPNPIFNEFDSQGLLFSLPRITEERNAAYKQRLMDIYVNPANSTRQGLINGITRELGLTSANTITISNTLDGDGNPVLTFPAVVFEETKCYLYSDFGDGTITSTIDRFDADGSAWILGDLVTEINSVTNFTAVLASGINAEQRSMTIWDQTSVPIVLNEDISGKGHRIKLVNSNLVTDTVTLVSSSLNNRVTLEAQVLNSGDYYIDLPNGLIVSFSMPSNGSTIRYQYRSDTTTFKSSPVIVHSLQSSDFKTKMFQQIENEDGDAVNGGPTVLGADIINELLSVFPTSFGK